eukprot:1161334-Pelagomonas_calceolata.AAC.8
MICCATVDGTLYVCSPEDARPRLRQALALGPGHEHWRAHHAATRRRKCTHLSAVTCLHLCQDHSALSASRRNEQHWRVCHFVVKRSKRTHPYAVHLPALGIGGAARARMALCTQWSETFNKT